MAEQVRESDPSLHLALTMKRLLLLDGVALDDIRDYARKQLILRGFSEPETEEEMAMLEQAAQQQDQPDPQMLLAMAEMEKAKADQAETMRKFEADRSKTSYDANKAIIKLYRAQTDRMKAESSVTVDQTTAIKNLVEAGEKGDVEEKAEVVEQLRVDYQFDPVSGEIRAAG